MSKNLNQILNPETVVLSAKLKLDVTTSQYKEMKRFSDLVLFGLNYVSKIAFENNIMNNAIEIQKLVYSDLKDFGLPSQISISICRQVASTYKGLKTKRATHNKIKRRRPKRFKGLDKPAKFKNNVINMQFKKDYSLIDGIASVKTQDGRMKVKFHGWDKHLELINSHKIGAAVLTFNNKNIYLTVSIHIPTNLKPINEYNQFLGIDVGQRKLAVTVGDETKFYSGDNVKSKRNHYLEKRTELQSKGTSSARKRLKAIAGKETRFMTDVNHCISKEISIADNVICMEDLNGIRFSIEPNSNKKNSKKKKRANVQKTSWSFSSLQSKIEYKSLLKNSLVCYIDPKYTSMGCPVCGHVHKDNRPNKGELFQCVYCGTCGDADVIGATNISYRGWIVYLVNSTGLLSEAPDVISVDWRSWWNLRFHPNALSLVTSLAL